MVIHVVKPGDTVYNIARMYDVPMQRIISDNDLREPVRLTPGQTLVVQFPEQVYTVQPGDTLGDIAVRNGTTVFSLWQNNPWLGGNDRIRPGEQLVISYQGDKRGSLAVNGYAYPHINRAVLRKTLPYLTYLSVFSFGAMPDGTINVIDDAGLPTVAREFGVAPLMVLTTLGTDGTFSGERAHELLNNPQAQRRLTQNLIRLLSTRGYAGVDVDFEYIPPQDREAYAEFISMLTQCLNQNGLIVMVALAPKTSGQQRGLLYEAHDYRELGAGANYALVMTYEWGYASFTRLCAAGIMG